MVPPTPRIEYFNDRRLRATTNPRTLNQSTIQLAIMSDWQVGGSNPFKSIKMLAVLYSGVPERIDNFDPVKISLIVGHYNTAIGLGNGRDNRVQSTSWAARRFPLCH